MKMWKKIALGVSLLVIIAVSLYFTYFRHPPAADILAANMAKRSHPKDLGCCCGNGQGADYDDYDDEEGGGSPNPQKDAKRKWDKFINKNNFVPVGELYTKCEGDDKIMIGTVIMLPDPKTGGVMTRTFANVTIDKELTGGDVHVVSMYNGKELYNSIWELCTAEEGMTDKIIVCPIQPGKRSYVKDLPIPGYLPKGKFFSKAWVTDSDENVLGCSVSEFTI